MQSEKPVKRRFTTPQQHQQKLLNDFFAELDEGLFEQVTSDFEAEVEGNDDDDNDIRTFLPDEGPDGEVPEEGEVDVNRDVDGQEDEVLTDELPKKKIFMSTGVVCDDNNFSGSLRATSIDIQIEKLSR